MRLTSCEALFRDQHPTSDPRLGVFPLDAVVGLERLNRLLILAARPEPDPGGDQVRASPAARQRHLLADRGHRRPGIKKVRDLVSGQALEVFGLEPSHPGAPKGWAGVHPRPWAVERAEA